MLKKNVLIHNLRKLTFNMRKIKCLLLLFILVLNTTLLFGCSIKVPVPQILYNTQLFIKQEIKIGNIIGGIRNIQKNVFLDSISDEIAVVGQSSYFLLSPKDYKIIDHNECLDSNRRPCNFGLSPQLLDINNDHSMEIMLGGGGFGRVGLTDSHGMIINTAIKYTK